MKIFKGFIISMYTRFFPEEQLILLLCQFYMCEDRQGANAIKKLLNRRIHWDRVVRLIQNNKLWASAVDWQKKLLQYNIELPDDFIEQCNRRILPIHYFRKKQQHEAIKIFKSLLGEKIDFVVMKSFVLSYGSQWRAPKVSEDIDLLVSIFDYKKAALVLLKNYYTHLTINNGHYKSKGIIFDFYLPQSQESFRKNGLTIELHTTIVDTFFFLNTPWTDELNRRVSQELYDSAHEELFRGVSVRVFSPTHLFISLFLHSFFQHNLQGGSQYLEAAEIINRFNVQLDWKYIFQFMKTYKIYQYFLWFMSLLHDCFPLVLTRPLKKRVENYMNFFSPLQQALFMFMKYKILHAANFLKEPWKEKQKEWSWAIINSDLTRHIFNKILHKLIRNFATIIYL